MLPLASGRVSLSLSHTWPHKSRRAQSLFGELIMRSEPTFITDLKGVGPTTASKLKEAGFTTIESIAVTPKREINRVVVTNQIQSNPQAFFVDPNRPAGGNIVAHASTHRIYIRKGKSNTRIAHVIDSPYLLGDETRFAITAMDIEDAEEQ